MFDVLYLRGIAMKQNRINRLTALLLTAVFLVVISTGRPVQAATLAPTIRAITDLSNMSLYQGEIGAFQFETTRGGYEVENAVLLIYNSEDGSDEPVGYADLTIQDRQNLYGEGTEEKYADKSLIHWIVDWDTADIAPGSYIVVAYIGAWSGDYDTTTERIRTNQITGRITINADTRPAAMPMYRLYYPGNHEHFYTASAYEKQVLTTERGWNDEGIGWYAPRSSGSPVYRLFHPVAGEHLYTRDKNERNVLVENGWNYEGVGWYSDTNETVPVWRQFSPILTTGTHNYTTDAYEKKTLIESGAWNDEGIGWYGVNKP